MKVRLSLVFALLCFAISALLGYSGAPFGSGAAFAGGLVWAGLWVYDF